MYKLKCPICGSIRSIKNEIISKDDKYCDSCYTLIHILFKGD